MFAYPKQAELNRVVPKTKIYAHAKPSKRVKAFFVAQVAEIRWKYKLSPDTINLPARNGVNEIQIFEIVLKTPDLDAAVLQTIDKAITEIRTTRDTVHFILMDWDPLIAQWQDLPVERGVAADKALGALYKFLASRFSTGKSLMSRNRK